MHKVVKFLGGLGLLAYSLTSFAYENVGPKEFKKLMKGKDVVLLDVRTPDEYYKEGHIEDANLIPVQLFRHINLGGKGIKDKTVLVYCRSGRRSALAAEILEQWGVKKVYNLSGGILSWKRAGYKVVKER